MFEPDATLTEPGLDLQRTSATQCTDFQVFGERGSGTNFLTALVRKNLKLRFWQQYGWKHGFPVAVGYSSQSLILGIYRDPVDWLVSLFNVPRSTYAVEVPNDFSEFIRRPFVGVTSHNYDEFWRDGTNATIPDDCPPQHLQCDRHPVTGQLPDTPMALRNLKIAALIGFKLRCANVALVQYERLREDRRVVVDALSRFYDIDRKGAFDAVDAPAQPPNAFKGRSRIERQDISRSDLSFIWSQLDHSQERALGYEMGA